MEKSMDMVCGDLLKMIRSTKDFFRMIKKMGLEFIRGIINFTTEGCSLMIGLMVQGNISILLQILPVIATKKRQKLQKDL